MIKKKLKKKVNRNTNTGEWLRENGLKRVCADLTEQEKDQLWEANLQKQYVTGIEFKPFLETLLKALARHPHRDEIIAIIMSGQWEGPLMDIFGKLRKKR